MSSNPQPNPQQKPQAAATQPATSAPKAATTSPSAHTPEPAKKVKKKGGGIPLDAVVSWGATIVIIGLMFKIQHWKGGEGFITAGLSAEAILFAILGFAAISANKKAHAHDDDHAHDGKDKKSGNLDELLANTITPEAINRLGKGFEHFNRTVESVNHIAGSYPITQNMLKEMESTTTDMKKFRENVGTISGSVDQLGKTLQAVGQAGGASQALLKDFESASAGTKTYSKNIAEMAGSVDQFSKALGSFAQVGGASQNILKDFEVASAGVKAYSKNLSDMNASIDQFTKSMQAISQMAAASQNMVKEFEAATKNIQTYNKNLTDLTKIYQAQLDAFKK
jgi:methyl-accepting chemotaxis protein